MPRYRLTLEYDGTPFVGWQRQDNGPSVQQALEDAIFGFCGRRTTVVGAGRTDAGVHATGQVAHVDLDRELKVATVRDAINFHLQPRPVAVISVDRVADDFHARFSARGRAYRYRLLIRPAPPVLDRGRLWWQRHPLDADAMAAAAAMLTGRHDFTSFRSTLCQAPSAVKTLDSLVVRCQYGGEITIEAHARSFLHHQVRIMVGTLVMVGRGRWRPADVSKALAARDRRQAGPTAPPQGLCLTAVSYD